MLKSVAIPSNRVNVSYYKMEVKKWSVFWVFGRNPLKSGQCFLPIELEKDITILDFSVAIPSNRVNVSYLPSPGRPSAIGLQHLLSQSPQIGSMFPTLLFYGIKKFIDY